MKLSIIINDITSPSEVFLRQLFNQIGNQCHLEFLSFKKNLSIKNSNYLVRYIPPPFSLKFLIYIPFIFCKYKTTDIRILYYIFILELARSNKIYFPFLYMVPPFGNALKYYVKKNNTSIYSSIRGTEVTINSIISPKVINDFNSVLPFISKLHFLSEDLATRFRSFGLSSNKSKIIYQGLDFSKFLSNKKLPKDKLRLITVGRFDYIKGIEYLLLTCRQLKLDKINFFCTIVGYGPDEKKFKYMVYDMQLEDCVTIVDKADHGNLPQLLTEHNLYIHPHIIPGISNTMLEAFGCGLPVIAFYSNFASYPVQDLMNYFKEVPRYDVGQLTNAIKSFDFVNSEIPLNDRKKILEKFTLEHQVKEFIDFFELN